jgi:hypothetical protein
MQDGRVALIPRSFSRTTTRVPPVPRVWGPGITDDLGPALDARNDMTPTNPIHPIPSPLFLPPTLQINSANFLSLSQAPGRAQERTENP